MSNELVASGVLLIVFGGTLLGFFMTKNPGFGRFNTSVLLLVLVVFVAGLAFLQGQVEVQALTNLMFAVAGYAGGLLTGKGENARDKKQVADAQP